MFKTHAVAIACLPVLFVMAGCSSKPEILDTRYDSGLDLSNSGLQIQTNTRFDVDTSMPIKLLAVELNSFNLDKPASGLIIKVDPNIRQDGNGYPVLIINETYSEAWEEVILAVTNSRLSIEDQDRETGIIYLNAVKGALFDNTRRVGKASDQKYQLAITKTQFGTEISVQYSADELADVESSSDILNELINTLSS